MSLSILLGSVTVCEDSSRNVVLRGLMLAMVPCAMIAAPLLTDTASPTMKGLHVEITSRAHKIRGLIILPEARAFRQLEVIADRVTKIETPLTKFSSRACDANPTTIPDTEPSVRRGLGSSPTSLKLITTAAPIISQDAKELAGSRARRILAAASACTTFRNVSKLNILEELWPLPGYVGLEYTI